MAEPNPKPVVDVTPDHVHVQRSGSCVILVVEFANEYDAILYYDGLEIGRRVQFEMVASGLNER